MQYQQILFFFIALFLSQCSAQIQLDAGIDCTDTETLLEQSPEEVLLCAKQLLYRTPEQRSDGDIVTYDLEDVQYIQFHKVQSVEWPYYPDGFTMTEDDVIPFRWYHNVQVIIPKIEEVPKTAFLLIDLGDNDAYVNQNPSEYDRGKQKNMDSSDFDPALQKYAKIAKDMQAVVIVLLDVPNQPIQILGEDMVEDVIVAFTWRKFIENSIKYTYLPVHLPMSVASSSIMEWAIDILDQRYDITIEDFVVSGFSKRGWTTWMTSLLDSKVKAIAPITIDILNVREQYRAIYQSYGNKLPLALGDYNRYSIVNNYNFSPDHFRNFDLLNKIMDPVDYRLKPKYRARMMIPKLLVMSAGDDFFVPQGSQLFYKYLPNQEQTFQFRAENTSHFMPFDIAFPRVVSFFKKSIIQMPKYPRFEYQVLYGNDMVKFEAVFTCQEGITCWESNLMFKLWVAENSVARDFRYNCMLQYQQYYPDEAGNTGIYMEMPLEYRRLDTRSFRIDAEVNIPENGWKSAFISVEDQTGFTVSSSVQVVQGRNVEPYSTMPQRPEMFWCNVLEFNYHFH